MATMNIGHEQRKHNKKRITKSMINGLSPSNKVMFYHLAQSHYAAHRGKVSMQKVWQKIWKEITKP